MTQFSYSKKNDTLQTKDEMDTPGASCKLSFPGNPPYNKYDTSLREDFGSIHLYYALAMLMSPY